MQSKDILAVVKRKAKSQGLTQAEMARELKVSLPTLKRWLRGDGVSVEALLALLALVEMDLEDFSALLPLQRGKTFSYTLEQETFFAEAPHFLAYFDRLLAGDTPRAIARHHALSTRSTRRYLARLERLALIAVLPGDRFQLKVSGEPVWREGGPLVRAFRARGIEALLRQADADAHPIRLGTYRVLPADLARLREMAADLATFARTADRRARGMRESIGVGMLVGLHPFEWSLLREIRDIGR